MAVIGALGLTLATLTLVPALAQVGAEEGATPYVELMTSLSSTNQYIRYVDEIDATVDPQQGFTSLTPWVLSPDPELVTVAGNADPRTVLAGTPCLDGEGNPIGPLPAVLLAHTAAPAYWFPPLPLIGVTSYACNVSGPTIVPEDSKALITPGETLSITRGSALPFDFRSLKLNIHSSNTSEVRIIAKRDGDVVGTIDVDIDVDCVNSTDWQNADTLCATRVEPYFGALQQRYLNLDFGEAFDSFDVTATAGSVRIKGNHASRFFLNAELFTGTIGGGTGESATSQPPTDTLPGYEVACTDASDPPPEGPCGGKDVSLDIARYLADLDDDGNDDQVLDVVPSGDIEQMAFLSLTIEWAPEDIPVGAIPLSGFDEDGAGPDDVDPASWCSADPPGAPGDQWCLDSLTTTAVGDGKIQVTETYRGTGDPRAFR